VRWEWILGHCVGTVEVVLDVRFWLKKNTVVEPRYSGNMVFCCTNLKCFQLSAALCAVVYNESTHEYEASPGFLDSHKFQKVQSAVPLYEACEIWSYVWPWLNSLYKGQRGRTSCWLAPTNAQRRQRRASVRSPMARPRPS
jgi:hypothetical protein